MIWIPIAVIFLFLATPLILKLLGFHPHMVKRSFNVEGKRALIITTSQKSLGNSKKKTGVFASEMTVPYYEFRDNGMVVDIASVKGGKIPIEGLSLIWPVASWADRRFKRDKDFREKVENSQPIESVNFSTYDVIFFAGGWGAAYDLGFSDNLGKEISKAYKSGAILGSVCHGVLGLIKATDEKGEPLLKGRKVTGVTNKQIKELRVTDTPQHPETELRKIEVDYKSKSALLDIFATCVVRDERIITGQNQNSGQEAAYEIMELLEKGR